MESMIKAWGYWASVGEHLGRPVDTRWNHYVDNAYMMSMNPLEVANRIAVHELKIASDKAEELAAFKKAN